VPRYVALLRSVNVAGHGRIAMDELRASFDALGYTDVTTYIQTGNVLFSTGSKSQAGISSAIEQRLDQDFGDSPAVLLRSVADLRRVGSSSPFAKAGADPDGYANTKYTGTFLERRLGVVSTTRNWNTVTKLGELASR
jgi:uncharacterized protein (DUF1697 family)